MHAVVDEFQFVCQFPFYDDCRSLVYNNQRKTVIRYDRDLLLSLRNTDNAFATEIPNEIRKTPRKRGRKGGIRARLKRRGSRVPMPTVAHGNVRLLRNKKDELISSLCRYDYAYRTCSLMCFTETWLQPDIDPGSFYQIDGFTMLRSDMQGTDTKKSGGGLCTYVNEQ